MVRTISVTQSFSLADLDVGLRFEHPFRNDIKAWLTSPAGSRVQLLGHTAAVANLDVQLNDAARRNVTLFANGSPHYLSGDIYAQQRQPYTDLLYTFRGENVQGDWQLALCDDYAAEDEGFYVSGQLSFQAQDIPSQTLANWQYELDLPKKVENMPYALSLYGYDSVDNQSQPINLSFNIDTLAPRLGVSVVAGTGPQGTAVTASGTLTEANAVAMRLIIRQPDGRLSADRIAVLDNIWSYSNTAKFAQVGVYKLWFEATDEAGNVRVVGPYQIARQGAEIYQIYLPVVTKNYDGLNRIYLPLMLR